MRTIDSKMKNGLAVTLALCAGLAAVGPGTYLALLRVNGQQARIA